ncbi:MAG: hypothetical protein HC767_02350 [Akkermansiaceae bacterium]|nr:hypothetical protein [Akkermansiaceae bacterium]
MTSVNQVENDNDLKECQRIRIQVRSPAACYILECVSCNKTSEQLQAPAAQMRGPTDAMVALSQNSAGAVELSESRCDKHGST